MISNVHTPRLAALAASGAALAGGAALALALVWSGCSDPTGPSAVPAYMTVIGGADQTAIVGTQLQYPLVVRVAGADGALVKGAAVHFSVRSGGGSLSAGQVETDEAGTARTRWTLGTTTSQPNTVEATVQGASSILTAQFDAIVRPGPPKKLAGAGGDAQTGPVAVALQTKLSARVTDAYGNPVPGVSVAWLVTAGGGTLDPANSTTDASGLAHSSWKLGTAPGANGAAAAVAGLPDTVHFHAAGVPGPVARVTLAPDTLTLPTGTSTQIAVALADAYGNTITGRPVVWTSADPTVATVSSSGVAFGIYPGVTSVRADAEGQTGTAVVTTTPGTAPLPTITGISPDTLRPGATATVDGMNFGSASGTTVTIAGVQATVTQATSSRLTLTVPPAASFPCAPALAVPVGVRVSGVGQTVSHDLSAALPISLAPGASVLLPPDSARCVRLPDAGGSYTLSVANGAASAGAAAGFALVGNAAGGLTLPASAGMVPVGAGPMRVAALPGADGMRETAHLRWLARNAALLDAARGLGAGRHVTVASRTVGAASPSAEALVQGTLPSVGDTISLRVPDVTSPAPCDNFATVRARVAYVGPHAVVLEDVAAPLPGLSDSVYASVAHEFETVQYPILLANFGDPMAYDAQLGGTGHVLILLTPRANAAGDLYGFTFAGDLLDNGTCHESNRTEIFYGVVPTDSAPGAVPLVPGGLTREGWRRVMRATLIHEAKHIVSYAEKLSLGAPAEEPWLEEATAMVAEELWARQVFGYAPRGDVAFGTGLSCELRPADPACAGTPLVLDYHFNRLADYLAAAPLHSALGPVPAGDASFFGSSWSLLRWAIDQYAESEPDFLKALVQETRLTGIANLEARTGHPFPEMLADWSLALALDDAPTFSPARPQLMFPSWNLPSVFAGFHQEDPQDYPSAWPSAAQPVAFGVFGVTQDGLPGGTAAIFNLSGTQTAPEFIQLRAPAGANVPGGFRLEIVRVR